ncbi:HPP family protein [Xylophilus sp. GW821-FHT01B05]
MNSPPRNTKLPDWLRAFRPAPLRVDARERWRMAFGAVLGVLVTALLCRWVGGAAGASPWLVAPIGASAVLVFAVPASPLAQPWAVVGGNTVSALIGWACVLAIGDAAWAGAVAVGLAIAVMMLLRCLHPPGGASALLVVLAHAASPQFAMFPVLANSLLLVAAGMAYHHATGRRYPHAQVLAPSPAQEAASRFSTADLDAALSHYNQVLDVSRDDLQALLHHAEMEAYRRNLGELRCADIMSRAPLAVEFGTGLQEAWALMRQRRVKALPVVDRVQRIVGIVTVADFMREADLELHHGLGERLRAFMRRVGAVHSDKPEVVGQIMTRKVRVASEHRHVIELVPLFSEGGHHHIPIIDAEQRLAGIITQSDLVRALYRAVRTPG